jgi:predicted Rossmann-fold nucleotide-binding protein
VSETLPVIYLARHGETAWSLTGQHAGLGECLRGKVAVVTGAARGIGRATAVAIAREGANLVGIDICAPVDPRSGVEPSKPDEIYSVSGVLPKDSPVITGRPFRAPHASKNILL